VIAVCIVASGLFPFSECRAVLFESTGSPAFNTSAPGGSLSDSGWQFEGQWGDFLGTPVAPMFFLAAKHVGGTIGDPFVLNGFTYHTVAMSDCPDCDLRLWEVAETFPSYAPMYAGSGEVNQPCVVFGRGTDRGAPVIMSGQTVGWTWGATNWVQRWGQNTISGVETDEVNGQLLFAFFGANGCDLSIGDSSGGIFIKNGSTWQLGGINYGVDGPFSSSATGSPSFDAALTNMSGFYVEVPTNGGTTWIAAPAQPSSFVSTRVSANIGWINGVIGTATNWAPVASFFASPTNGSWPLTVTFTDTSTGTITNRFWSFGDGSTTNTTANILTYTYNATGTNTVSLTASGPAGTSSVTNDNYIAIGSEATPSTPAGLAVTFVSANEIDLSWMASTNVSPSSFTDYEIFRNGIQINAIPGTTFADTGLAPNSNYCYSVAAFNSEGGKSAPSAAVCTNTLATPGSLMGAYSGLIWQANTLSNASSGSIQLTLSKTGKFTAKLTLGGAHFSFQGVFDASGNSTHTITPHTGNLLQVILGLDLEGGTGQITGTVSDGTFTAVVLANRAVFRGKNPCPWAGRYAVVFSAPPANGSNLPTGTGSATLTVTKSGSGRMSGVLADGTKISISAAVSGAGTWPLYEALYKKQGACIGWVTFGSGNTLTGTVDWFRPAISKSPFPLGFSTTVTISGQ
jgi:PKD repeat protein